MKITKQHLLHTTSIDVFVPNPYHYYTSTVQHISEVLTKFMFTIYCEVNASKYTLGYLKWIIITNFILILLFFHFLRLSWKPVYLISTLLLYNSPYGDEEVLLTCCFGSKISGRNAFINKVMDFRRKERTVYSFVLKMYLFYVGTWETT